MLIASGHGGDVPRPRDISYDRREERVVSPVMRKTSEIGADIFAGLPNVIDAVGSPDFGFNLLAFLHKTCGAEHSAVFHLDSGTLREVTASSIDGTDTAHRQAGIYVESGVWRRDPTFQEAAIRLDKSPSAILRTDVARLADNELRDVVYGQTAISDRVLICAKKDDSVVGLSVLRSSQVGTFSACELKRMESIAASLLALLAKHINILWRGPDLSVALTSLEEIETCISETYRDMPRREAEVCSRIIYGVSSLGIALELGISPETVMTYRKRAYQRLAIATQRELFIWYLAIWSRWPGRLEPSKLVH